jgi:hypothetical protein
MPVALPFAAGGAVRVTSDGRLPAGPRQATSTVPSLEDEAIVVAFRKHTLLRWTIAFTAAAEGFESEYNNYQNTTTSAAFYALSRSLVRGRENATSASRFRPPSTAPLWS